MDTKKAPGRLNRRLVEEGGSQKTRYKRTCGAEHKGDGCVQTKPGQENASLQAKQLISSQPLRLQR